MTDKLEQFEDRLKRNSYFSGGDRFTSVSYAIDTARQIFGEPEKPGKHGCSCGYTTDSIEALTKHKCIIPPEKPNLSAFPHDGLVMEVPEKPEYCQICNDIGDNPPQPPDRISHITIKDYAKVREMILSTAQFALEEGKK